MSIFNKIMKRGGSDSVMAKFVGRPSPKAKALDRKKGKKLKVRHLENEGIPTMFVKTGSLKDYEKGIRRFKGRGASLPRALKYDK